MYLLPEPSYAPTVPDLFRKLNRLFVSPLVGDLEGPFNSFSAGELMTNVREDDESFYVEMEIPGVKPEEVDVSLTGTELTVKIQREECKKENPKERDRYLRRERCVESMSRTIDLPLESSPKDVRAEIKDGVLRVTLRKPAPAKVKKIEIAAAK